MSKLIPTVALPSSHSKDLYHSKKVYVRKTEGRWQRLRRAISTPLLLAFLLTPWLKIDGRPAVFFDLSAQQFHIFWATFWPQDGILLAWLLIIAAFGLFAVTVWAGRVWCGFSCPQTVWTLMFIWVEERCEGERNSRIKLDAAPWGLEKLLRKTAKHSVWLLISLLTSVTFIAYFYGVRDLLTDLFGAAAPLQAYIWVGLFALLTYLNAGYLREQVCKHMCPYSRFQSVMYDRDTLLVSYDQARGENRGARSRKADYKKQGLGDCIDCDWCVQVCPADIDIRDGLQAECIDCGLCIDACDNVMERMGYAKGLISFSSERGNEKFWPRLWRPRLLGYSAMLLIMIGAFSISLDSRIPLGVDIIRDRGVHLYRQRGGFIENVYTLKLNNMSNQAGYFSLSIATQAGFEIDSKRRVYLEAGEVYTLPLRVRLPVEQARRGQYQIEVAASAVGDNNVSASQATVFYT
ncbi:MAG: cytochrome c oxidase accessory protein CcoG, partial [Cellvibrionaceae bacterium]|nr:cytochrome c oxidase accessory protein CcoG [Cellvibrionaceae bacterium]